MDEMALWTGAFVCKAGLAIGMSGLRCYEQVPLQTLGWSTGVILALSVVLISRRVFWPT
jgi:hypothetical protein